MKSIRIIGLDPGLRRTGWGVIDVDGTRLSYVGAGVATTAAASDLAERLAALYRQINEIFEQFKPNEAAVEETFVNRDGRATLKLGQARAVSLLVPALRDVGVAEYAPNKVKKTVVGVGHAQKQQIDKMVRLLLPTCGQTTADSADALAIAICHAQQRSIRKSVVETCGDTSASSAIVQQGGRRFGRR